MSSHENTRIVEVSQEDAAATFLTVHGHSALPQLESEFSETVRRLGNGSVFLWVAYQGDAYRGHVLLNTRPAYASFKRLGIPEIQDLSVDAGHRQQGFATKLVAACEAKARALGLDTIGLGVALCAAYGPAQRLYGKLGYLADGAGLVHDANPVEFGALKPNDDDLCLMMIKAL